MEQALAFGTYIPGSSVVHRTKAQVKIILTCAFSIAVFCVDGWVGLGVLALVSVVLYALARVGLSHALAGMRPVYLILVFTIVAHMLTFGASPEAFSRVEQLGGVGLQQQWVLDNGVGVTADGFMRGLYFALRIALLFAASGLLTFTTTMMELADALLWIVRPLRVLHVPVEDVAMVVAIALRFVPTTISEAYGIVRAQKARCAPFEEGSVLARVRAWGAVFVPLFVRLFRRAEDLAQAMDARCYRGKGRTHLHASSMTVADVPVLSCGLIAVVAIAVVL